MWNVVIERKKQGFYMSQVTRVGESINYNSRSKIDRCVGVVTITHFFMDFQILFYFHHQRRYFVFMFYRILNE